MSSCREALHQQEQRTAQMKRLLQKDILIKAASVCYTFGRFTYPQVRLGSTVDTTVGTKAGTRVSTWLAPRWLVVFGVAKRHSDQGCICVLQIWPCHVSPSRSQQEILLVVFSAPALQKDILVPCIVMVA
jgi:hypothetical protein